LTQERARATLRATTGRRGWSPRFGAGIVGELTTMRTLQLEFAADPAAAIAERLAAAGVSALPGCDPVPMRGQGEQPATVVVTVLVPSGVPTERLYGIPGVLRVTGYPAISPPH